MRIEEQANRTDDTDGAVGAANESGRGADISLVLAINVVVMDVHITTRPGMFVHGLVRFIIFHHD